MASTKYASTTQVNNENLNRQLKGEVSKNLRTKRLVLKDLPCNVLNAPVNNPTNAVPRDVKKTIIPKVTKDIQKEAVCCSSVLHLKDELKQFTVVDVDANDKGDPYLVPEYVQDVFKYLRKLEETYPIHEDYMKSHQATSQMRSVLVNWMIEVQNSFKLLLETLHLSIAILDRYLQIDKTVGKKNLQLVGVTAMVVACKYEEIYMPQLTDFADVTEGSCSTDDIKKMEIDMLLKLDFNLGRPFSIHFLRRYNKIAKATHEHHTLGKYLLEICLLHYELCYLRPSLQAAAACCLAISILKEVSCPIVVWTRILIYYSTYKYADVKPVIIKLAYCLCKMEKSKFQAIKQKYKSSNYGAISLNPKLHGLLIQKLASQHKS